MDMDKSPHFELREPMDGERSPEEKDVSYIKPGTAQDNADMQRLGKKQQLSRGFHSISIFGLTCVIMLTWQAILSTSTFSLINGGRAGSVYSYLASWLLTSKYYCSQSFLERSRKLHDVHANTVCANQYQSLLPWQKWLAWPQHQADSIIGRVQILSRPIKHI